MRMEDSIQWTVRFNELYLTSVKGNFGEVGKAGRSITPLSINWWRNNYWMNDVSWWNWCHRPLIHSLNQNSETSDQTLAAVHHRNTQNRRKTLKFSFFHSLRPQLISLHMRPLMHSPSWSYNERYINRTWNAKSFVFAINKRRNIFCIFLSCRSSTTSPRRVANFSLSCVPLFCYFVLSVLHLKRHHHHYHHPPFPHQPVKRHIYPHLTIPHECVNEENESVFSSRNLMPFKYNS